MPLGYDSMDSACASSCKSAAISTRQAMFLDAFASHAQSGPPSIETHESNRSESSIRVVTPGHQRFSGAESSSRTPSRGFVPTPPIQVNRNRSRINHSHTTSAEVSSESARKSKRKHEDSASDHTPVQNFIRPRKKTCKLFLPTTTAPAAAAAAAAALTNTAPTSGASSLPIARDVSIAQCSGGLKSRETRDGTGLNRSLAIVLPRCLASHRLRSVTRSQAKML